MKHKNAMPQQIDRKKKNQFIFSIQEKERAKISRDIHDTVIQDIRVIRLEIENIKVHDESKNLQHKIEDIATDCIIKLRNICYNLAPAELVNHSEGDSSKIELVSIINSLAQQFSKKTHVPCHVGVEEGFEYPVLKREVTQNIFRVVQEALTNIEKHSYATQTSIFIKNEDDSIVIYVTDDGIGCSQETINHSLNSNEHLGLRSMHDRIELIGGKIEFISSQDDGMEIRIEITVN
ncbi:MAG: histidine kinase [Treponema sp.]|nr:histidine kinase [Treponema sp.]